MADTLVLRLELEKGLWANFPENYKSYTDVRVVAGLVADMQLLEDSASPVLPASSCTEVRASGEGLTDVYSVERPQHGMYIDNIAGDSDIVTALEGLFKGRDGKMRNTEQATFVGEQAIAAAVEALEANEHYDAILLHQLSLLAVNYAQRDVQDTVTTPRF